MKDEVVPFSVEPNAANHFAWAATVMGVQRTQMAAVRTGVTLIGFGFTVAELFQHFQNRVPAQMRMFNPNAPRDVGLVLIAAGLISLSLFTLQYRRAIAYLRSPAFRPIAGDAPAAMTAPNYLTSFTVLLIGVLAFATVLLRL